MADVFISYKREDIDVARRIADALAEEGFSAFFDLDPLGIHAGEDWAQRLERELNSAKACVVLWSPDAVASPNVRSEARRALERGILVPVKIAGCTAPIGMDVLQETDLQGWKGDRSDGRWRFLIDRGVRWLVSPSGQAPEPQPTIKPTDRSAKVPRRFWAGLGGIVAAIALIATLVSVFRGEMVSRFWPRQTEYMDVAMGMDRREVLAMLGYPTSVLGKENSEFGSPVYYTGQTADKKNQMPEGTTIDNYNEWMWDRSKPNEYRLVEFDKVGKVIRIVCFTDSKLECPPMYGVRPGMSEKDVVRLIGKPNFLSFSGSSKSLRFMRLGIGVSFEKNGVYMIQVFDPAALPPAEKHGG